MATSTPGRRAADSRKPAISSRTALVVLLAICLVAAAKTRPQVRPQVAKEDPQARLYDLLLSAHDKPKVSLPRLQGISYQGLGLTPADQAELDGSMKKRRELAWKIVRKVWKPTPIAGGLGHVPTWMTWYEQEDFERAYRDYRLHRSLDRSGVKDLQESLSSARLSRVLRQFQHTSEATHRATGAIYYSPPFVTHLLLNAGKIAQCDTSNPPPARAGSDNKFARCMDSEKPTDAVMIKVAWRQLTYDPAMFGHTRDQKTVLKDYPNVVSGEEMVPFLSPHASGLWNRNQGFQSTLEDATRPHFSLLVTDEEGQVWALVSMHIAAKVLRRWLWISVWFNGAHSIWGSDMPADMESPLMFRYERLGKHSQWPQFEMCVVSGFEEKDPDPGGPLPSGEKWPPALGPTMNAFRTAMGGAQWCANPNIEPTMIRGNCVGCHQGSPDEFLPHSLHQERPTNPSDFSFSYLSNRAAIIKVDGEFAGQH